MGLKWLPKWRGGSFNYAAFFEQDLALVSSESLQLNKYFDCLEPGAHFLCQPIGRQHHSPALFSARWGERLANRSFVARNDCLLLSVRISPRCALCGDWSMPHSTRSPIESGTSWSSSLKGCVRSVRHTESRRLLSLNHARARRLPNNSARRSFGQSLTTVADLATSVLTSDDIGIIPNGAGKRKRPARCEP